MNDVSKANFWNECYNDNNTGWDLGKITPVFKDWVDKLDKKSKILVPGCGNGYDPLYFASLGHDVVAVDFSEIAVNNIKSKLKAEKVNLKVIKYDFFNLLDKYKKEFDYIIEYTFFCAIDPKNRDQYINITHKLLKDNGYLIGLFLPFQKKISEGGPPFAVRKNEIKKKFVNKFDLIENFSHPLSINARKENELFYKFKKK